MAGRTRLHSDMGTSNVQDDISFRNTKKRILFEEEAVKPEMSEHMKCYLRIRPFSEDELSNNEDQKCLSVDDEHTVIAYAPKDSHTFKNCTHGLGKTTHKFKFSRIFDANTTQRDFFNDTMLGLVKDFIDGQNCLVFTYGVTSSGKTYTIQGKPKDAGILPRALDVIFNSINGQQWPTNQLKPKMFMDVVKLSAAQSEEELKNKERTMKMVTFEEPDVMSLLGDDASDMSQITNVTTCSESSNASLGGSERISKDSLDDVFTEVENRVREEAAVSVDDQGLIKFSVWVSFAEIYNEQIFDLLEPIPKKKTTRRPVLRLSDDKNGSPYIRGLKEIHVTSADEAYNLLTVGQKNLRTACTKLNHQSSRSHCIFNIKIIRVVDKGHPNHARVSMLSLCDLAGSERQSKTQSKGDRLKEAGNINTSLMTLGRCIEILRNNQHHKDKTQMIPFRDSKLTRLFQNFFCGRGKAAMIVNVNQCASMFDETLHVFKFSAVAKQVVVVQKPDPPPKKRLKTVPIPKHAVRPSIPWATPGKADLSLMNSALKKGQEVPLPGDDDDFDEESDDDEDVEELLGIIEDLKEKLKQERRSKLVLEKDVREEVCKEMMEQIVKIETEYEEQLRERDILAEEKMERRIKILTESMSTNPRKRMRQDVMEDEDDEWVSSILLHQEQVKRQDREKELESVKGELDTVKKRLNTIIKDQEDQKAKNTSLQFKLADTEKSLKSSQKAEKESKEEIRRLNNKLDDLVSSTVQKRKSEVDLGESCLLETLSQQLQQAKDQIKEQEGEMTELNAMLTEAGETFQQREKEIKQLQEIISEDEVKIKQQEAMIAELQTAVMDSKHAISTAEERLVKRDEQIVKLEADATELQESLRTQKNCSHFLEEALKQKEEEISSWRGKLSREESESFKREQALINGYKAEITNLKTQIQQFSRDLKLRSPSKSPLKKHLNTESPAKVRKIDFETESPRKSRNDSPARKLKKTDNSESEDKRLFEAGLSKQIKDLQDEFMKNSLITAELESTLHAARLTSDDLESRLENEQKLHRDSKQKLGELQAKMRDYDEIKTKLEEEMVARKKGEEELEKEVKGRQLKEQEVEKLKSELTELENVQILYGDLKNEYEELEKNLATKVEENLTMEGKIKSLEEDAMCRKSEDEKHVDRLKTVLEKFSSDVCVTDNEQIVGTVEIKQQRSGLESLVDKLETVSSKVIQEVTAKTESTKCLEETIEKLKLDLSGKENKNVTLTEKLEEIETVNASLRDMVNQTTNHIQAKETEIKEIVHENLQACESPSSNSLTNLRKKMKDLKVECDLLKTEHQQSEETIDNLKKELNKTKTSNDEKENEVKTLSEKVKDIEFQLEEKSIEMMDMIENKINLETKINELETVSKEKTTQLMELNDELNKVKVAREMLEADLRDMEEEREALQEFVEKNSELRKDCEDLSKNLADKNAEVNMVTQKVEEQSNQLRERDQQIDSLKDQLSKLENGEISKKQSLKQTMEAKEREINDLKQEVNKMEAQNKEIHDLKQELSKMEAQTKKIEEYEQTISKNQKEIQEFKEQREGNEKLRLEYEEKIAEIEHGNQELMKEQDSLKIKLRELEEEKCLLKKEIEDLKAKIDTLSASSDEEGESKMKIAELKSELHMQKTLYEQTKQDLEETEKELEALKCETRHEVSSAEMEQKYDNCMIENETLKTKCDQLCLDLESKKEELQKILEKDEVCQQCLVHKEKLSNNVIEIQRLKRELENSNFDLNRLQTELDTTKVELDSRLDSSVNVSKLEIDKLSKVCTQQEMLIREKNLEIKKIGKNDSEKQSLRMECEELTQKCKELVKENAKQKLEVDSYRHKTAVTDKEVRNLNEAISQQQRMICQQAEKIKELVKCGESSESQAELDKLKLDLYNKNEELEDMKAKLQVMEKSLVTIKTELSSKEQIVENLKENLNAGREMECLSPTSQSSCARKLRKEKIEIENQLIEARFRIKQLENEGQSGLFSSPRKLVSTESMQRSSVTSPTVHRELNRSQEREQNLRSQLQMASQTVKQQNERISELEKQLLDTETKLRVADDSLKQRQSFYGQPQSGISSEELEKVKEESRKRWQMIQDLEKDLQKKESKIQAKTQTISTMKQSIEIEKENFEAARKDASANEAVIEELKNAIALQEETMEEQDRYIQQKEETITKLQQEVEKFTDKYHNLLTSSGDSSREIREMTRENARHSAELEQNRKNLEDLKSQLKTKGNENSELSLKVNNLESQLKEKVQECKTLTDDKAECDDRIKNLEEKLHDKREECDRIQETNSKNNNSVQEIEDLQRTIEELKSTNENLASEKLSLLSQIEQLEITIKDQKTSNQNLEVEIRELRQSYQKQADDKLLLSTVIKENNEELKEMEKLLSERRRECEALRSQNNTERLESLQTKYDQQEKVVTELKTKIKDKDHTLREAHKEIRSINEELSKTRNDLEAVKSSTKEQNHETSEQLQQKNKEIIRLQQELEKKLNELNNWKQERDKLVQGLETIMTKQQTEINDLKSQRTSKHRHKSGHSDSVPDSTEDVVIIKQEVKDETFQSPPQRPPPPSRRGRKRKSPVLDKTDCDMPSSSKKEPLVETTFMSEGGDTSNHIEIDATPAIAAKNLRRARKKRSSVDLLREDKLDKENKRSTRGRKAKNTDSSLSRIMSVIKESPITRSAKKFIEDVSTTPGKDSEVEVEDHGTQMSPAVEVSGRKSRKRHNLYKEQVQISEPLDCGRFVEPSPEDVHGTVQRKLRGRRK